MAGIYNMRIYTCELSKFIVLDNNLETTKLMYGFKVI